VTPKEILIRTRERLTDPNCWAKGYYAYDSHNEKASMYENDAVRWCVRGAMMRVTGGGDNEIYNAQALLARVISPGNEHGNIANWNDAPERTHAAVLSALDKAIAELG